jgi:hypothetical protein
MGYPGFFNAGENGGNGFGALYCFYALGYSGFASNTCYTSSYGFSGGPGAWSGFPPANSLSSQTPGSLEAGYGVFYTTNALGSSVGAGTYSSALGTLTWLGINTLTGGTGGISVLPGRAVIATTTGIATDYVTAPNAQALAITTSSLAPFSSPVAMPDGTVYLLANGGASIARCHIPSDQNVTTGTTCDASAFADISSLSANPGIRHMVLGPDGALWVAAFSVIGRYDLTAASGALTTRSVTGGAGSVAAGNDGKIYYTNTNQVYSLP